MKGKSVAVVGLGHVGIPLACLAAKKGYSVYGIDVDKSKLEKLVRGINPLDGKEIVYRIIVEEQYSALNKSDNIVVCVPTPVDGKCMPDLEPLVSASKTISKSLRKGHLVSIESTVNPGVCEEIVKPVLESSGLDAKKDFYLVHCPERVDPGNKKWDVENIPRVIGGLSKEGLEKGFEFYSSIINSKITKMSSIKVAEAVKITENTFRDVNIAFVNELAKSFDNLGIDVVEVINGASTKPFAFLAHYPGCGVGGHCIPIDPYYLIEKARSRGFEHKFLKLAREINDSMPEYTVDLLKKELKKSGGSIKDKKVGVLGVAYKGGINDIRESPSIKIIEELKKEGANPVVFDPYISSKSDLDSLDKVVDSCDCIILATDHPEFKEIEKYNLKSVQVIIDGKNFLDKDKISEKGVRYKGIGR